MQMVEKKVREPAAETRGWLWNNRLRTGFSTLNRSSASLQDKRDNKACGECQTAVNEDNKKIKMQPLHLHFTYHGCRDDTPFGTSLLLTTSMATASHQRRGHFPIGISRFFVAPTATQHLYHRQTGQFSNNGRVHLAAGPESKLPDRTTYVLHPSRSRSFFSDLSHPSSRSHKFFLIDGIRTGTT